MAERSIQAAHEEIVRAGLFGVLRMTPALNSFKIVPFTISRAGTSGSSIESRSGLMMDKQPTGQDVVIEGHTPEK